MAILSGISRKFVGGSQRLPFPSSKTRSSFLTPHAHLSDILLPYSRPPHYQTEHSHTHITNEHMSVVVPGVVLDAVVEEAVVEEVEEVVLQIKANL